MLNRDEKSDDGHVLPKNTLTTQEALSEGIPDISTLAQVTGDFNRDGIQDMFYVTPSTEETLKPMRDRHGQIVGYEAVEDQTRPKEGYDLILGISQPRGGYDRQIVAHTREMPIAIFSSGSLRQPTGGVKMLQAQGGPSPTSIADAIRANVHPCANFVGYVGEGRHGTLWGSGDSTEARLIHLDVTCSRQVAFYRPTTTLRIENDPQAIDVKSLLRPVNKYDGSK